MKLLARSRFVLPWDKWSEVSRVLSPKVYWTEIAEVGMTALSIVRHFDVVKIAAFGRFQKRLDNDEFTSSYLSMVEIPNYKVDIVKGNEVQMINS